MNNWIWAILIVGVCAIVIFAGFFIIGPAMIVAILALGWMGLFTVIVKTVLDEWQYRK